MPEYQVDFLPIEYHRRHELRRQTSHRILVGVVAVALVAALASWQLHAGRVARRELARLVPQYDQILRQNDEISKLQGELQVAQAEAELITYLLHPWPRTQLLRAVVDPLPDASMLREITIARDSNRRAETMDRVPQLDRQAQEQALAKLPRAARDLKTLREQFDRMPVVIRLAGLTSDDGAPHRYVAELGKNPLFAKADLVSLDSAGGDREGKLEFKAVVMVRPGYGLPDGPAAPPGNTLTAVPSDRGSRLPDGTGSEKPRSAVGTYNAGGLP
jgi:hypothetical protein